MNRKLHFLQLFLLFSIIANGVSAVSGYYIKLNGDTVKGAFLNIPDNGNPYQIDFIPASSNDVVSLRPEEVRLMKVGNYEYFLPYNGTRMLNQGSTETISTFLRQIGESNGYNFYSYSDSKRVNLFY